MYLIKYVDFEELYWFIIYEKHLSIMINKLLC